MIAGVELPDWSEQEGSPDLEYSRFGAAAAALARLDEPSRHQEVESYSATYCLPRLSIQHASALYVLLRVLFELPHEYPLDETKVFGGWVHPSIGQDPFDLSWPVSLDPDGDVLIVEPFKGYRGKGYDAIGEYGYFASRFPFRPVDFLERVRVAHA